MGLPLQRQLMAPRRLEQRVLGVNRPGLQGAGFEQILMGGDLGRSRLVESALAVRHAASRRGSAPLGLVGSAPFFVLGLRLNSMETLLVFLDEKAGHSSGDQRRRCMREAVLE